jgi:hypothetical protein
LWDINCIGARVLISVGAALFNIVENLSAGQGATIVDALKPPQFKAINALKGVTSVPRAENVIMSVSCDTEAQAKLLRINSGVRVVSFTPKHAAIDI